jgi:hypothetical protein
VLREGGADVRVLGTASRSWLDESAGPSMRCRRGVTRSGAEPVGGCLLAFDEVAERARTGNRRALAWYMPSAEDGMTDLCSRLGHRSVHAGAEWAEPERGHVSREVHVHHGSDVGQGECR